MASTVTFRLDPETARILKDLVRRANGSKSRAVKEALRAHWKSLNSSLAPSAWEVYLRLKIPPAVGPKRDRAHNASKLFRESLLAKRRQGTL